MGGRANQTPILLDLIIMNEEDMISDLEYLSPLGSSDHNILKFNFNCSISQNPTSQSKLNYHKANFDSLREAFKELNWENILADKHSVDDIRNSIKHQIITGIENHVPKRKIAIKL